METYDVIVNQPVVIDNVSEISLDLHIQLDYGAFVVI